MQCIKKKVKHIFHYLNDNRLRNLVTGKSGGVGQKMLTVVD